MIPLAGATVAGVLASVPTWGLLAGGVIALAVIAVAGLPALFGLIVISSGVSLTFVTGGERTLLQGLGGATLDGLRLAVVLGAFLLFAATNPAILKDFRRIPIYLAFLAAACLSILWSPDKGAGVRLLLRYAYPAVAFVTCSLIAESKGDRPFRFLCCVAAIGMTVTNALVSGMGLSEYEGPGYELRYHGAFHPNPMGLFCATCGLVLYTFWDQDRRGIYLTLMLLLGVQLVATGSRVGLLAGESVSWYSNSCRDDTCA